MMVVHTEEVSAAGARVRRRARGVPDPRERSWWLQADHPLPLGLRRPEDGPLRLIAATECTVLAGFREPTAIAANLDRLDVHGLADVVTVLRRPDQAEALLYALGLLFATGRAAQISLARRVTVAAARSADEPVLARVVELARHHGDDPGVLLSIFLHEVRIAPGDVLQIGSGMVYGLVSGRALHVTRRRGSTIAVGLSLEPVATGAVLQRLGAKVGPARLVPGVGSGSLLNYPAVDGITLAQVASGHAQVHLGPKAVAVALGCDGWVEEGPRRRSILAGGPAVGLPPGLVRVGSRGRLAIFADAEDLSDRRSPAAAEAASALDDVE
ncbi:hypothetical protein [Ruania halotolerans]|uniref:hypothetical protein n=1 Tax=Ruania halotolerans TaxID=2897773 RepID=UPI001E41EC79|nr:hypothetical protein [Ruania halotolerans]UFU07282.1 hypothetical protein LQF10_03995 [Ruania halotolerans]